MKKSIVAVLLSSLMVLSLAACGSNAETPATTKEPAAESNESEAETEEPAAETSDAAGEDETLVVWCWDPSFNIYAIQEAEKIYQKDHPNFKLDVVEVGNSDIEAQLQTVVTSGALDELPDIFLNQDGSFQRQVTNYPEMFADLTGSGIDFSQFAPSYVALTTVDGKNYGVPFDNSASVYGYRTDLLEEAGFTIDDFTDITWDEFIEKATVVKEKTGKNLISDRLSEPDTIMQMVQSAGVSLFKEDGSPNIANNADLKAILEQYMKLQDAGLITNVNGWDEYISSFVNGDVGGVVTGCWIVSSIKQGEGQSGKWALANVPKISAVSGATNYASNGGSSWAISSAANYDLATDFIASTFGASTELYDTLLEGQNIVSLYLPASKSPAYALEDEFFGGQEINSLIVDYAGKIPDTIMGVYNYNARSAIAVAVQDIIAGTSMDEALKTAEETVNFDMGN
ncbi:extracellular solute-binding protein [Lachnospiraceae bacterium ZAX-1]